MQWDVAPIDSAILGLVQLIQPAFRERVYLESRGTVVDEFLSKKQLFSNLERLEKTGFLLRTSDEMLVVAPKSYGLINRGLDANERDKARLLLLNKDRYR